MIDEAIKILSKKNDLNQDQMQLVIEEILSGKAATEQIIPFLTYLSEKGETIEELTAAVSVMRRHATRIHSKHKILVDTCGTGGDRSGTFNVSTAVAFVASGCGIAVAKHGNRSISSRCGSADMLEALGININMARERIEKCLDEIGIAFLFAQNLHPAMKYAMPARKQIGKRTMFNILGPLSNPAHATHQLVGVYDKSLTEVIARVLNNLDVKHALVVHGADGLDEITTTASTYVTETCYGKINSYQINPQDFGFEKASLKDLCGGDPAYNAKILLDILNGKAGYQRDIVVLNAAATIYATDRAKSIKDGILLAENSIETGKALEKLEMLKEYSLRT